MNDKTFRYDACGLDNVEITGLEFVVDDDGEECIRIPRVNELHKLLARMIVRRAKGMSGKELQFLRTEMGMTQAELAKIVTRDVQSIGRWERGEIPIDPNAELIIRLLASERLELHIEENVETMSSWCVSPAGPQPLIVDASDPCEYKPLPVAA